MNAADITARVRRLDELAQGIAHEIQLVEKADVFLYRERRDYFDALRQVWIGLENARIALAKALQRMGIAP